MVGDTALSEKKAVRLVDTYRSGKVAKGVFQGYDEYTTDGSSNDLVDGDLLAPTLLGVPVDSPTFVNLKNARQRLQAALSGITDRVDLTDASVDLAAIGRPFAVIDERLVKGASGTTLSKILHRKKPALVPIYDQHVWALYRSRTGSDRNRKWSTFISLLAGEMKKDLEMNVGFWRQWDPDITALRALDMVVWQLGRDPKADG